MKAKIVYESINGKQFENAEDVVREDKFVEEIDALLKPFEDVQIKAGEFVQRSSHMIQTLIDKTYELLVRYYGRDSDICRCWLDYPRGFVGRLLDDASSPAYRIWSILYSIDNKNRQWQQPYYAIQANKGNYPLKD